jgi:hypothetical protein
MKQQKTWVDYVSVGLVVTLVLIGVGVLLYVVGIMIALGNFGSNK